MTTRIVSGLVMAVVATLLIFYLPVSALKFATAVVVFLALQEFGRMALPKHSSSSNAFLVIVGTLFSLALMFYFSNSDGVLLSVAAVLILTFAFYLFRSDRVWDLTLLQIAITFLGILYIGLLLSFLGMIRSLPHGAGWLMMTLSMTFAADTGAYAAGHLWGKHKLAPQVSPGKTVEGLLGGVVASIFAAILCKFLFLHELKFLHCFWIGGGVGIVGPLGDLSESLIKRSVGVKDSGNLIPGHGGLLDRVDALLFTAPTIYLCIRLLHY